MTSSVAPSVATTAQPFLASDVTAFVMAAAAVLYTYVWRRNREPGMQWCAVGVALLAVWAATDAYSISPGAEVRATWWQMPLVVGLATMGYGMVRYLAPPLPQVGAAMLWTLLPLVALGGLVVWINTLGALVPLLVAQGLIGLHFAALAVLAWQASRREPGCGHGAVALAAIAVPGAMLALKLLGMRPDLLRYFGTLPLLLLCLTLLAVSLQRRQRLLEGEIRTRQAAEADLAALNATLEQRVAERTDDLRRAVAGLESFNRSISHDLRGPLGGIAQLARMAESELRKGNPEPGLRCLPAIARQAEHSTELLVALLELARVDDAPMQRRPVSLQAVARQALQSLHRPEAEHVVSLQLEALPEVQADPALLGAVFANLIGNAMKFSRHRPDARVTVRGDAHTAGVTVQVADNGEGFDSAAATALFKPFHRLHGARFEGHGIGLSIVRRVVERHGGRVWAESSPGAGATFAFSIPA